MISQLLISRRYNVIAAIAGGLFGVLLGFLSYTGALEFMNPFLRGIVGLIASAVIGVLVAPIGAGFKYPLSKGILVEAALVSALATLVTWPVIYAVLV